MKCLLQRVTQASVTVAGKVVGEIDRGLLVLVGVEPEDAEQTVTRMAERLLRYRVFSDAEGKMNLNVAQGRGRHSAGVAIYAGRRYHQWQPARLLDRRATRAGIQFM